MTDNHESANFLVDALDRHGNTRPSLSASCKLFAKAEACTVFAKPPCPSAHDLNANLSSCPLHVWKTKGSHVSQLLNTRPHKILLLHCFRFFFNVEPAHVADRHAPTFLTHVVHQKRLFPSFFAHQVLNTRGSVSDLVPVPFTTLLLLDRHVLQDWLQPPLPCGGREYSATATSPAT